MTNLYHREVGIPEGLQFELPYPCLEYSRHALAAAREDNLNATDMPVTLPERFDVVEIETRNGIPHKWTLCIHDHYRDLFLVVLRDGFVKTVWTADPEVRKVLQVERYTKP